VSALMLRHYLAKTGQDLGFPADLDAETASTFHRFHPPETRLQV